MLDPGKEQLRIEIAAIESENAALHLAASEVREQNRRIRILLQRQRCRFRVQMGLALLLLTTTIFISPANRRAFADGPNTDMEQIKLRLKALEVGTTIVEEKSKLLQGKLQYVHISGGEMYLIGTNLHIINGLKATNGAPGSPAATDASKTHVNHKGNLIMGYNEYAVFLPNNVLVQTFHEGSHNLILGAGQSYSSFGGIVGGGNNGMTAPYGSVLNGILNSNMGLYAVVATGLDSIAVGDYSACYAGSQNTTSGIYSSAGGAGSNKAGGGYSSVSGGQYNDAEGDASSVSGGDTNVTYGQKESASGGFNNSYSTDYGWAGWPYSSP